jgi:hypothetical protein
MALKGSIGPTLLWKTEKSAKLPKELSDDVLARLEQVRNGGNFYHPEPDAKSFLRSHPIQNFTLETNRTLARLFGKGFAGEVYQAWVESQGKNARFRKRYLSLLNEFEGQSVSNDASKKAVAAKLKGLHALVSMGLGWEEEISPSMPGYVRNFVTEIQETGVRTTILHRNALGTTEENIEMLIPQIEERLRAGEDVILFGLCKGSTEMLSAAAKILSPYLDSHRTQRNRPRGYGRVVAIIDLSAMIRGTFFADFVGSIKASRFVGKLLRELPMDGAKEAGGYETALRSITVKHLDEVRDEFLPGLPSDAFYVDVAGVVPGNGLIANDTATMRTFQEIDRFEHLAVGANDGFIEYPGNILPESVSPNHVTLIFNGTHMLTDGKVGSFDLSDRTTRLSAYRALYFSVFERLGARHE